MAKEIWFSSKGFLEDLAVSTHGRLRWRGFLYDPELDPERGFIYRLKSPWFEIILSVKAILLHHMPFPPKINQEWMIKTIALNKKEKEEHENV